MTKFLRRSLPRKLVTEKVLMNTETLQYAKLILIGRSSLIKKANNKMHQETKKDMETPRN